MSDLPITAEGRALIAEVSRRPVMDIVRGAMFIGILLLVWISLRPFADLSGFYVAAVATGQDAVLYGLFGVLMVAMTTCRPKYARPTTVFSSSSAMRMALRVAGAVSKRMR